MFLIVFLLDISYQSPYALLYNREPNYNFLKVFGSSCFSYLRPYKKNKLDQNFCCVYIFGLCFQSKGYICLDMSSKKIYVSHHVSRFLPFTYKVVSNTSLFTYFRVIFQSFLYYQNTETLINVVTITNSVVIPIEVNILSSCNSDKRYNNKPSTPSVYPLPVELLSPSTLPITSGYGLPLSLVELLMFIITISIFVIPLHMFLLKFLCQLLLINIKYKQDQKL